MKKISKKEAHNLYQRIIQEVSQASEGNKVHRLNHLSDLLFNVFRILTHDQSLPINISFLERMKIAFMGSEDDNAVTAMAHESRIFFAKHRKNNLQREVVSLDYDRNVRAILECIRYFSDEQVPAFLENFLNIEFSQVHNPGVIIPEIIDKDLESDPSTRLAVCIVVDSSESMNEDNKLYELEQGIKSFYEAVRKDDLASNTVEICVITFGKGVEQIIQFASLKRQKEQFKRMMLKAQGESPIGEALEAGLEMLDERKKKYKQIGVQYYQPWMILMTDGQPTDDVKKAAAKITEKITNRELTFFPIAIGYGCNIEILKKISPRAPLRLKGLNFREFFVWLGKSVRSIPNSRPGTVLSLPDHRDVLIIQA